jgi:hypothetical protein
MGVMMALMSVRYMRRVLAVAGLLGGIALGGGANAAPVTFESGGYSVGTGYGCTSDTSLLCVEFDYLLDNPAAFDLSAGGSKDFLSLVVCFINTNTYTNVVS